MAASVPTIGWVNINAVGYFAWNNSYGFTPATPVAVPTDTLVHFVVSTSGAFTAVITGYATTDSTEITGVSDMSQLAVGQGLRDIPPPPIGDAPYPPYVIPLDSIIATLDVGASTLTFANGEFDEDTNSWVDAQGASGDLNPGGYRITDNVPIGTLAVVLTGGGSPTVRDQNADGTGNVSYFGDGTTIASLFGGGSGGFTVEWADAGTYTVTAMFTTADPNYQDVTLSPPITVVVT